MLGIEARFSQQCFLLFQVLEGKSHFVEFGGNLVPVTKSGDQLSLRFFAFRENRIPFNVKVKDPHSEPMGRVAFMKEPKGSRGDAPQTPICNLNVALPDNITPDVPGVGDADSLAAIQNKVTLSTIRWFKVCKWRVNSDHTPFQNIIC